MSITTPATTSSAVATLFPGYFALVMATGIIAIGAEPAEPRLARRRAVHRRRRRLRRARRAARRPPRALPAGAHRRPHQPRQGLRLPDRRRRHQRRRQRARRSSTAGGASPGCCGTPASPLWAVLAYTTLIAVVHRCGQAGPRRRDQRHLVPADRVDRVGRRARRPAARTRPTATRWRSFAWPRSRSGSCSTSS